MNHSSKGAKQVKVNVVDDEKLPTTINLAEDIHASRRGVAATKQASKPSEPDWKEKYLRLAADLDNTKKRLQLSYQRQAEIEKEDLLADILEVADNLERAVAHADDSSSVVIDGVKTIQRQIQQILAKHEVRPFKAEGQPFNPDRHEAVSVIYQPDLPPNTVTQVTRTGYTIGDKVLRPAYVIVAGER
jgi:molecular chaperone GrpE